MKVLKRATFIQTLDELDSYVDVGKSTDPTQ